MAKNGSKIRVRKYKINLDIARNSTGADTNTNTNSEHRKMPTIKFGSEKKSIIFDSYLKNKNEIPGPGSYDHEALCFKS